MATFPYLAKGAEETAKSVNSKRAGSVMITEPWNQLKRILNGNS